MQHRRGKLVSANISYRSCRARVCHQLTAPSLGGQSAHGGFVTDGGHDSPRRSSLCMKNLEARADSQASPPPGSPPGASLDIALGGVVVSVVEDDDLSIPLWVAQVPQV